MLRRCRPMSLARSGLRGSRPGPVTSSPSSSLIRGPLHTSSMIMARLRVPMADRSEHCASSDGPDDRSLVMK
jgi:hypothetical protein